MTYAKAEKREDLALYVKKTKRGYIRRSPSGEIFIDTPRYFFITILSLTAAGKKMIGKTLEAF